MIIQYQYLVYFDANEACSCWNLFFPFVWAILVRLITAERDLFSSPRTRLLPILVRLMTGEKYASCSPRARCLLSVVASSSNSRPTPRAALTRFTIVTVFTVGIAHLAQLLLDFLSLLGENCEQILFSLYIFSHMMSGAETRLNRWLFSRPQSALMVDRCLILVRVGAGGTRGDFNRPTAWL
jgi:hypothetical protein